ncbi:MAG: substrate-binding domain-containing protein [Candidatus Thiodiazotropha endolucinida]
MLSQQMMLLISGLTALIGLASLIRSRFRLADSRLRYRAVGLALFFPGALAFLYLSGSRIIAQPEVLGVVGIAVSYFVGIYGKWLDPIAKFKPVVGIVIPSRVPFHAEIRTGIEQKINDGNFMKFDEADKADAPVDDIRSFPGLLSKTLEKHPDYLIIWPPGPTAACSYDVMNALEQMSKKGGKVVFLQNAPQGDKRASDFFVIKHDVIEGAKVLYKRVVDEYKERDVKYVVFLGPTWSGPGPDGNAAKRQVFTKNLDREFIQLNNWSSDEAKEKVQNICRATDRHLVIVCANDDMAVSLSHWVYGDPGIDESTIDIVGYDGTQAAYAAIAEPCNPMKYTLAIRPLEYGRLAGDLVHDLFKLRPKLPRDKSDKSKNMIKKIPVDETCIADVHSVRKTTYWHGLS